MNDRDYLRGFVTWYLRRAAVLIRSTEAAAFTIHRDARAPRFELLSHLRQDNSSEEMRFLTIALTVLLRGKKWTRSKY